jgi:ABC-type nitrate/sulfonate/bicarbonate transport system substrate-binding protein
MTQLLRIGGVPEHFNTPWVDVCADAPDLRWEPFPGGSGAMRAALEGGALEACLLLTEAAVAHRAAGSDAAIVATWVEQPLVWGIHVHAWSRYQTPDDLAGEPFAISRFGSGSHLMAFVEAHERGWLQTERDAGRDLRFEVVGDLQGARVALQEGRAAAFLWEVLTSKALVTAGEWRLIGTRAAPWPAFVLVARRDVATAHGDRLRAAFDAAVARAAEMRADPMRAAPHIARRWGLQVEDIDAWLATFRWDARYGVDPDALGRAEAMLRGLGAIR